MIPVPPPTRPFIDRYPDRITTIDSHTAGEITRLVIGGTPPVAGGTMADKLGHFKASCDAIRRQITHEPRGDGNLLAALLTEPVTAGAAFGLIFMDARRYPYLCGHATIGAVTTAVAGGWIPVREPETTVIVDTPSGPVTASAAIADGRASSVAIRMVPSFVYETDQPLEVPGLGTVNAHTVCVGGFFVMIDAAQLPFPIDAAHGRELTDVGMAAIAAANEQLTVAHPLRPEVKTVDVVEFFDTTDHSRGVGRSAVIYGEAHLDRSPCGTGTSAVLTLLHHQGKWPAGQPYESRSPLDTVFTARIVDETQIGDMDGVVVEIRGSAYLTGIHEFIIDPEDPLAGGFLI